MERSTVHALIVAKSAYNLSDALFVVGWLATEAPTEVLEACLTDLHDRQRANGRYDLEAAAAERWGPRTGTGS